MSHVSVRCRCGHTANAKLFTTAVRRCGADGKGAAVVELPPNQWRCPACQVLWEVTPKGIKVTPVVPVLLEKSTS